MTVATPASAECDVEAETNVAAGTSFVTVRLRNRGAVPRHVRLTNRLDGPVLPPRREGTPERGWTRDGFEGVVPADGRLALGYACRAAPETPPVEVGWGDRVTEPSEAEQTPATLLQRLGSPAPPRDAIPRPTAIDDESDERGESRDDLPSPVRTWFDDLETRIERRERLTDPSVPEATAVLDAVGGLAEVDALTAVAQSDSRQLEAVVRRAEALRERQAATDVSRGPLRRLAAEER